MYNFLEYLALLQSRVSRRRQLFLSYIIGWCDLFLACGVAIK